MRHRAPPTHGLTRCNGFRTGRRCSVSCDASKAVDSPQQALPLECGICLEALDTRPMQTTPCAHQFHAGCLETWCGTRKNCPLCRTDLSPSLLADARQPSQSATAGLERCVRVMGPSHLEKYTRLVRVVHLVEEMSVAKQREVASLSSVHTFKAGDVIYDEGAGWNGCWVVEAGTVVETKEIWSVSEANKKEWREMRTYKENQYLGDGLLPCSEPRPSRMTCRTDCTLLRIPADAYLSCLASNEGQRRYEFPIATPAHRCSGCGQTECITERPLELAPEYVAAWGHQTSHFECEECGEIYDTRSRVPWC